MLQCSYAYVSHAIGGTYMKSSRARFWKDIGAIVQRHTISVVTFVMGSVIILLLWFGELRDALFLSSVLLINIFGGIFQEVRARLVLERLASTLPHTARRLLPNGKTKEISSELVAIHDSIVLQAGDQIPVDGHIISAAGFEINEAFLTGESTSVVKNNDQIVYAGSFVTAGQATIRVVAIGQGTKLGMMTDQVKKHEWHSTPIQRALAGLISTLSYVLLIAVVGLAIRRYYASEDPVSLIKQIAALTGTIIPEGLILASTLLFAYGAIRLLRRQVLLQHIHSAEALARLQILCLDKTGTLTEQKVTLAEVIPHTGTTKPALIRAAQTYFATSDPDSALAVALNVRKGSAGTVTTSFASERRYGAVLSRGVQLVVGAPESISQRFTIALTARILAEIKRLTTSGQRVVIVASSDVRTELKAKSRLKLMGIISFEQSIKPSAARTLNFFKQRAVAIKIISGDHPAAVKAVAQKLNLVEEQEKVILGSALMQKEPHELIPLVRAHSLFARITPQQKAQLIQACRKIGYTGMVGDGANDALAIKKADLGISMFDAAAITRSVADIVLLKNEFNDLPRGVRLADSIITTMELIGSLFLNKVIIGLTLLVTAFITATPYPFSPRNITVLNYFIIGLPILIWTLYPRDRRRSAFEPGYLRQIMPFVLTNGIITSVASVTAYLMARLYYIDVQMTLFATTLVLGVGMLIVAPRALDIIPTQGYGQRVIGGIIFTIIILAGIFVIDPVRVFFGLHELRADWVALGLAIAGAALVVQFASLHRHVMSRIGLWLSANGRL